MTRTPVLERLTASDMFLLLWDDYGWSSDIGGLAICDGTGKIQRHRPVPSGAESPAIGLAEVRVAGAAKDQGPAQGDAPMSGPRRGGTLDSWPAIYSTTGTNRTSAAWCSPRSKDTTARFATGRSSPRAAPARTRSGGRPRPAVGKTRSGGWPGVAVRSEASAKLPILPWGCRGRLLAATASGLIGGWVLVRAIRREERHILGPPQRRR